ncbi:AraC family transcriptional regulator [Martelella sp. HB161492]|uniref:AraC family transcriptional regulator n=1 Tax=Martelella sp. HB161492 TaxID=2720726 RepID=UPI00159094C1|nr:AraC family transcriptional regulator [Martelella sp. HB161492]
MSAQPIFQVYGDRLNRVMAYIHDHLDDDLDFARIAEIACLSPWHWHRIYRGIYGETITQTVKRLRLHRAADQLVNSDTAIAVIASRAGYASVPPFNRQFKAAYGMPPAAYRGRGRHMLFDQPLRKGAEIMFDVEMRIFETRHVAGVLHKGPYIDIGKGFERVMGAIFAAGQAEPDMRMIGIYHDDPDLVAAEALSAFAGVIVSDGFTPPVGLDIVQLAGGPHAVLTHRGPYAELHKAYGWLYGQWLVSSSHEPADRPPFEIYLNTPRDVPPSDLLTEICLPLKP